MKLGPRPTERERIIEIGEEGDKARFHMKAPSHIDVFSFEDATSQGNVRFVLSKIHKIENLTYDDGTAVTPGSAGDIPAPIIGELVVKYFEWMGAFFEQEKNA